MAISRLITHGEKLAFETWPPETGLHVTILHQRRGVVFLTEDGTSHADAGVVGLCGGSAGRRHGLA